jgi:hypothetical protein
MFITQAAKMYGRAAQIHAGAANIYGEMMNI